MWPTVGQLHLAHVHIDSDAPAFLPLQRPFALRLCSAANFKLAPSMQQPDHVCARFSVDGTASGLPVKMRSKRCQAVIASDGGTTAQMLGTQSSLT
jgi:hypothetical protein